MRILKWIATAFVTLLLIAVFDYTLPNREVVKIVGTEVKRMDVGRYPMFWARPDAATELQSNRDVRFINTVYPNGKVRVYRNEDTDWRWPPYFKFESGNITAEAQALEREDDQWVAVTHYGWRIKIFTIFPNITNIIPVAGPDVWTVPWFRIVFVLLFILLLFWIYRRIQRFKEKRIDPVTDSIQSNINETIESARATVDESQKRTNSFLKRWFGSAKKN